MNCTQTLAIPKKIGIIGTIIFYCLQPVLGSEKATFSLAQNEPSERKIVSGGFGVGLGIFFPKQVNDYIKDATSHLLITTGFADMITNYIGKASISVRPVPVIEISVYCEFAWAPKFILVSSGDNYYFSFTKISPVLSPKIHIPLGSGRNSLFFAPAVSYNFMKFKDVNDGWETDMEKCWGWKLQVGFNLEMKKIILKPYLGYDHAKATNGYSELNYSGAQLGIDFHF